jgi:hypothetical protein
VGAGRAPDVRRHRIGDARSRSPTDFADTPGFGFPVRFRLEIADDAAFASPTTVVDHTTADFPNPGDAPFTASLDHKRGRFVRVTATRLWERHKGGNDFVFALGELQAYSGGRNVALGGDRYIRRLDRGRAVGKAFPRGRLQQPRTAAGSSPRG